MVIHPINYMMGDMALIDEHISAIQQSLFKDDASAKKLNTYRFTAGENPLSEVLGQIHNAPFLASKQLVIFNELDRLNAAEKKALLSFIEVQPKFAVLVLTLTDVKKAKQAFFTQLGKIAHSITCRAPYRQSDFIAWLRKYISMFDKQIDHDAAERLVEFTGREMAILKQRVNQLSIYIGDRSTITVDDIDALFGETTQLNAFQLYEALQNGRYDSAYKIVKKIYDEGGRPHDILGALIWQAERALKIRNMLDQGIEPDEIGRALNIHRFFLNQTIAGARKLDKQTDMNRLDALLWNDAKAKRGMIEAHVAVEQCLLKLCL